MRKKTESKSQKQLSESLKVGTDSQPIYTDKQIIKIRKELNSPKDEAWLSELRGIIQNYSAPLRKARPFNKSKHVKDVTALIKAIDLIGRFNSSPAYLDIICSPVHATPERIKTDYDGMIFHSAAVRHEAIMLLEEISKATPPEGGRIKGPERTPGKNALLLALIAFYKKTTGEDILSGKRINKKLYDFLQSAISPKDAEDRQPIFIPPPFKTRDSMVRQVKRLILSNTR